MSLIPIPEAAEMTLRSYNAPTDKIDDVSYRLERWQYLTVAIFPGTETCADVAADISIWRTTWAGNKDFRVHAGFAAQALMILPRMRIVMPDVLVGHSLGAGIAQLVAVSIDKPVITFGSPRVGNGAFAKVVAPLHTRVSLRGDNVATLPLWWCGYEHGQSEQYLLGDKQPWWNWCHIEARHFPSTYIREAHRRFDGQGVA